MLILQKRKIVCLSGFNILSPLFWGQRCSEYTHTVRYMQYLGNNRFGRKRYRLSIFLYRRRNIIEHNEQTMNCPNTSFPGYCKRVISSFKNEIKKKWFRRKLAHVAFLRLIPYSRSTVWQYYVQRKVILRSRI